MPKNTGSKRSADSSNTAQKASTSKQQSKKQKVAQKTTKKTTPKQPKQPKSQKKSNKPVTTTDSSVATTPAPEIKFPYKRLPRAPLLRLLKEMAHKRDPESRVQSDLLDRLELYTQQQVDSLVEGILLASKEGKRKTMMAKDLDFILEIRGEKNTTGGASPVTEIKFPYKRLPRAPLLRLLKDMAHKRDPNARVQSDLLDRVELHVQEMLDSLMEGIYAASKEGKRKTMMEKDLEYVLEFRGEKPVTSVSATVAPASSVSDSTTSSN